MNDSGLRRRRSSGRLRRRAGLTLGLVLVAVWVAAAVLAPLLSPAGPFDQQMEQSFRPPSRAHPFGTDDLGRDVLARVLYGGRITLTLGAGVVAVGSALGLAVGAASGFVGGWTDEVLMRATEVIMAFPSIILAMAIAVALGPGIVNAGLAMVLVWWPPYARLVRGEVLAVKQMEYVEASVALGQTPFGVLWRAILPNVSSSVIVLVTVDLGGAIITGAGLSFLGLGAVPPSPEWGAMVNAGKELYQQWWVATFPGLAMFMVVLGFNFLGDGVRDLLGPGRA
ncbi:MAG: ABC transporter permease [Armatimonadetes bacterium]|nr:ABC transporter permease [Armatimonadota bacterium]